MNLSKKLRKIKKAFENHGYPIPAISIPELDDTFVNIECVDIQESRFLADILRKEFETSICDVSFEESTGNTFRVAYTLEKVDIDLVLLIDLQTVSEVFMNLVS